MLNVAPLVKVACPECGPVSVMPEEIQLILLEERGVSIVALYRFYCDLEEQPRPVSNEADFKAVDALLALDVQVIRVETDLLSKATSIAEVQMRKALPTI